MVKRLFLMSLLAAASLALWLSAGCGPSTDLIGTPIPNIPPSTRVTASPPSLIETGFLVQFNWTGYDPDGRVVKYQWRISDNGTNGISVRDTLTFDPVTGDTLNPWFETAVTDSIFIVTADIPHYPGDAPPSSPSIGARYPRSFQTHTFWIRAVDDKGAVDPTPAHVSFTSTTLLPSVEIRGPSPVANQQSDAVRLPTTATFSYAGHDPDFYTLMPTKVRYLWKEAKWRGNDVCRSVQWDLRIDEMVCFDDSLWSDWQRYPIDQDQRRITIPDLSPSGTTCYFFAIQVQDTAGAVSIGRAYGKQVGNVRISDALAPTLLVTEPFIGRWANLQGTRTPVYAEDIAAGQPLNFQWTASADAYLGTIESYQYGWNVSDPDDPADPNWDISPGLSPEHQRLPFDYSLSAGVHTLTVKVRDNSNQVTIFRIVLSVVQIPPHDQKSPVLMIDDVPDRQSQAWPGQLPGQHLDNDIYRDAFWLNTLYGPGGVVMFNPILDIVDIRDPRIEPLTYRRAVNYKTLLWNTRFAIYESYIADEFRPDFSPGSGDLDKFVWLLPYQQEAGNLLYCGNGSVLNLLAYVPYSMPIIFESREGNPASGQEDFGTLTLRQGFGRRETHGETEWVGPTRYPFRALGISVLDVMSATSQYEYGTVSRLSDRRKVVCSSMKAVVLDPAFKARYLPGGADFPDTIYADQTIDWQDQSHLPGPGEADILTRQLPAEWDNDEFYNEVIIARGTPYTVQQGAAWGCEDLCVEPMFRSFSRFNWIREERRQVNPDDDWPMGYYRDTGGQTTFMLSVLCGTTALTSDRRSARTNNRTVGFIAHKLAADKPSEVGDVVLGFDPYRFNNGQMTKVIQWVLGGLFGLDMVVGDG